MPQQGFDRRHFLKTTTAAAGIATGSAVYSCADEKPQKKETAESIVKLLYENLSTEQKKQVCFDWNYQDEKLSYLSNITKNAIPITLNSLSALFFIMCLLL